MLDALEQAAARVTHHDRQVDLVSNVTGAVVGAGELGPGYWRRHVRQTVRFADSVRTLADQGYRVFLEIGPHPTLLGMAQGTLGPSALCLPSLRRDALDWRVLSESLAALYVRGARTDWAGYDRAYPRRKVQLPTYPFERQRYWLDSRPPVAPDRVTAGEAATLAADFQSRQAPFDFAIGTFPAKWALLERLTTAYEITALRALGAFARAGERVTVEALRQRLGIGETYRHLLLRWLAKLADEGYLQAEGDEFAGKQPLPDPSLPGLLAEAEPVFADYGELLSYVRRCGDQLALILTGRVSPLETLFPGGSFAEAEAIYQHSAVARYLNAMVRAAVQAAVGARPGRVALLEIGAGTGGTSASVLSALPADRTTYVYTDMSDLFLTQAQEKFAGHAFVRYSRLDIERDPSEQGYSTGSFDVIVAANVLHATRDLRKTLDHVRRLLAPGGVLVLSETTAHPHYFDITTGLIEGWQSFEDDLRDDNPLIDAPRWEAVLREQGFEQARAFPEAGLPTEILGNHVIVATVAEGAGERRDVVAPSVAQAGPAGPSREETTREALRAELAAAHPAERREMLAEVVRTEVMKVLRLDQQHPPDLGARLLDLGLDSLMAVQFRNRLVQALGGEKPLSSTLVFDHPTCEAIGAYLDVQLFGSGGPATVATPAAIADATPALLAHDVEQMSDEETEALLLKRLESMPGRSS
jgi:SAM-dependent methyltransferase